MAEAAWRTNILNALERSEKQLQLITALLKQPKPSPIPPFFGQTRLNAPTPVSVTTEPSFSYADGTPAKALIDSDRHVQADVLTIPPVSVSVTEKGFSNAADTPTRALVDADRHVQVDVLSGTVSVSTLPPVTQASIRRVLQYPEGTDIDPRQIRALTASDIITIANQVARDTDGHGQVDVLTCANPSNLDVSLSSRASESTLSALKNALASVGTDKVRTSIVDSLPAGSATIGNVGVNNFPTDYAKEAKQILIDANGHGQIDVLTLPSLPAGTNTIGNVNAIKSGTWNVDNLLNPHPVQLSPTAVTRKPFSLSFSAAGDQAIWTPASGKKVRLHFISFESDADVAVGWRFGTTETAQVCRITKGVYAANFIGAYQEGETDQALNIRAEGAVNVKGYVLGQEL